MKTAIVDLRKINAICKGKGFIFDKTFKYCISGDTYKPFEYKGAFYELVYTSGCFYPYLCKVEK